MARPIKQGLDYFPLDVEIDDKIELIEAKHGISGFGILIKVYQKIYKEGYYIPWSNETLLILSKRINVDRNEVSAVINDCLHYQIFHEMLYSKYKILSSSGIQKRYLNAVDRRKEVNLVKKYIIVDINKIIVNINWIDDDNYPQSKVKESKVKDLNTGIPFEIFWNQYSKKVGDRNKCEKKWHKLNKETQQKILDTLPQFKNSVKDPQYLPYPEKYLNQERWNDQLVIPSERMLNPETGKWVKIDAFNMQ